MERVGGKRDCVGKGEDMVENGEAMGETRLREKRRGYRGKYRGYGVNEILWEERRGCVKKGEDWGGKGRRRKREEEEKVWGRRKEFGRKGALLAMPGAEAVMYVQEIIPSTRSVSRKRREGETER